MLSVHPPLPPRPVTADEKHFFCELGARIAALRQKARLTQAELADRLQVSQQTVNSFEKGRRRVPTSTLPELADILGVSVEELVGKHSAARPAAKRGPEPRLQRQMEQIQRLPRAKQRMVIEMIDAMIAQAQRQ